MPNSPRMGWPYPAENQRDWYRAYEDYVNALDSSAYAAREDRSIMLLGGGTLTWNATTGELSWSADLELFSPITGFLMRVGTTQSPLVVAESEVVYVNVTRNPTNTVALTILAASAVPSSDQAMLLAIRYGTSLIFRTGAILLDGESKSLFEVPAGGETLAQTLAFGNATAGQDILISANDQLVFEPDTAIPVPAVGQSLLFVSDGSGGLIADEPYWRSSGGSPQRLLGGGLATRTIAQNELVDGVTLLVQIGQFAFDPTVYGSGKTFEFEVVLYVNDVLRTATATLYNLTDGEAVTSTTLTAVGLTTPTKRNSGTLTVGAAAGNLKDTEKIYEVRLAIDGTVVTEVAYLGSAIMRILG